MQLIKAITKANALTLVLTRAGECCDKDEAEVPILSLKVRRCLRENHESES